MMFSDYVHFFQSVFTTVPETFFVLFVFVIPVWFLSKLFRTLVLNANWGILIFVGLGNYGVVMAHFNSQSLFQAIMFSVPLFFIGREAYQRLAGIRGR